MTKIGLESWKNFLESFQNPEKKPELTAQMTAYNIPMMSQKLTRRRKVFKKKIDVCRNDAANSNRTHSSPHAFLRLCHDEHVLVGGGGHLQGQLLGLGRHVAHQFVVTEHAVPAQIYENQCHKKCKCLYAMWYLNISFTKGPSI